MKIEAKYIINSLDLGWKMIRYNFKIIFAGKFFYFLLAAFAFFIFVATINLFSNSNIREDGIFYLLLFPGMLLTFYPTVFGIQNDDDNRMLEIIFGIPNYRYKVWLVRLILIFLLVFVMLILFAVLGSYLLYPIEPVKLAAQLLFPVCFWGACLFS